MDNFDLRKFLAESKQPIQEVDTAMEEAIEETAHEAMEEIVAEYVTEALGCSNMEEVAGIIEARCNRAAMEMKMETIAEVLNAYEGRLAEIKETAYFQEMVDETKLAAQEGMIKELHEMAMAIKEEYKEAYMPEEETVEEEAVEEGDVEEQEEE